MQPSRIGTILETINNAKSAAARRARLEQAVVDLVSAPDLGAALVRQIGQTDDMDTLDEAAPTLLTATLDHARLARENGQRLGAVFLQAMEDAIDALTAQKALTPEGRLLLAQSWLHSNLRPPAGLSISVEEIEAEADTGEWGEMSPENWDDQIVGLIDGLLQQVDGDITALPLMFAELLATLPADIHPMLVAKVSGGEGPACLHLARAWLLDADPVIREAAAQGLEERFDRGLWDADLTGDLSVLRSWLPADAARGVVDKLIMQALRKEFSGPDPAPLQAPDPVWMVDQVLASVPDGVGAQTVAVFLKAGRKRALGLVLMKHGLGIREVQFFQCKAAEHRQLLSTLTAEMGALPVPLTLVAAALSQSMAEGLEHGRPPAPALMDVVKACTLNTLRPQARSAADVLHELAAQSGVAGSSTSDRARLIDASAHWGSSHPILDSWFEHNDEVSALLTAKRTDAARDKALWTWLESRRDYWGSQLARTAMVLHAAQAPLTDSVIATGLAVVNGQVLLKKIPLFQIIHTITLNAWANALYELDEDADEDLPPSAVEKAAPETKGELDALLKDTPVSGAWVDGYLMAVCLSPKPIEPTKWAMALLSLARPPEKSLQRFLDLLLTRYNGAIDALDEGSGSLAARLDALPPPALADWARGFTDGQKTFKTHWPAKSLSKTDRSVLRQIGEIAASPEAAAGVVPVIAQWLEHRQQTL